MTGAAFNPSGITSEDLRNRENSFREQWKNLTDEEIQKYYDKNLAAYHKFTDEHNISSSFEQCCFERFCGWRNVKFYKNNNN